MNTNTNPNLYVAHNQWMNRPADQRFWTPADALVVAKKRHDQSRDKDVQLKSLSVVNENKSLRIVGPEGRAVNFTHHSFGALSRHAGTPTAWLRTCRDEKIVVDALNYGIQNAVDRSVNVLLQQNGSAWLRDVRTKSFSPLADYKVLAACAALTENGWDVPRAAPPPGWNGPSRQAVDSDILPASKIQLGQTIAPGGIYSSDHDLFCLLVSREAIMDGRFYRFAIVRNAEVAGVSSFWLQLGLLETICQNHILWGAKVELDVRSKHVGDIAGRAQAAFEKLAANPTKGLRETEAQLKLAATTHIAATLEDVVETVWSRRINGLTRTAIESAVQRAKAGAELGSYSDPRTVLGVVEGLTEYARDEGAFADDRFALDLAAAKLLDTVKVPAKELTEV